MKELLEQAATLGFTKWFEDYAEEHHGLQGWLEYDQYLDEVELPTELTLTLLQCWLRTSHNIEIETFSTWDSTVGVWYVMYVKVQPKDSQAKVIYNPSTILASLKAQDPACDVHQFKYKSYEIAVEKGIVEALKFIRN